MTENFLRSCQESMQNNGEHFPASAVLMVSFTLSVFRLSIPLALQISMCQYYRHSIWLFHLRGSAISRTLKKILQYWENMKNEMLHFNFKIS